MPARSRSSLACSSSGRCARPLLQLSCRLKNCRGAVRVSERWQDGIGPLGILVENKLLHEMLLHGEGAFGRNQGGLGRGGLRLGLLLVQRR